MAKKQNKKNNEENAKLVNDINNGFFKGLAIFGAIYGLGGGFSN